MLLTKSIHKSLRETLHDGLSGSCIAEQVQREVNDVDMDLFSVVYVSGFIARRATCCEV